MGLLESVTPYLEGFRGFVSKGSGWIATAFSLDSSNIYFISILLISIFLSKGILEFFYTTLEGRKLYWIILTVVLFWILKFVGS